MATAKPKTKRMMFGGMAAGAASKALGAAKNAAAAKAAPMKTQSSMQAAARSAAAQAAPKQMQFMSDMLRGAPLSQTGSSVYQAPPSMLSQVGGLGAMAYGQYLKAPGSKRGGPVKSYASGGLVQIALQKIMQD